MHVHTVRTSVRSRFIITLLFGQFREIIFNGEILRCTQNNPECYLEYLMRIRVPDYPEDIRRAEGLGGNINGLVVFHCLPPAPRRAGMTRRASSGLTSTPLPPLHRSLTASRLKTDVDDEQIIASFLLHDIIKVIITYLHYSTASRTNYQK